MVSDKKEDVLMRNILKAPLISVLFLLPLFSSCTIPEPPDRVALVYGISEYGNSPNAPNLELADDDANAMNDLLNTQGFDVILKTNSDATKLAILNDILFLQGFNGLVVFYYSGHGFADNNESYICPKDIWDDTKGYIWDHLISATELFTAFKNAGLMHVVVFLDSCFSGGFVQSGATVDAVPPIFGPNETPDGSITYSWTLDALLPAVNTYMQYASYDSIIVISAGGAEEPVYESGSHGIFTYYLLQSPNYSDLDRDNLITTSEMYRFISNSIQTYWNNYYKDFYDSTTQQYADFHPHLTGSPREYIIFNN